jgi:hypothetical protein
MVEKPQPKKISDADKRVNPRVECELTAEIRTLDDAAHSASISDLHHKNLHFHVRNVSLGGLYLESPPPLKKGEILRVQATLPGIPVPLQAFGEVCWSGKEGGGLRFLAMAEQSIEALQNYIRSATLTIG